MRANTNRNNDGRQFQALLETIHSAYESRGIAMLRKTDPPVRVIGSPFKARVIFQENPWLDYAGTWGANDGRAIIIEAKATSEPTLRIIPEGKDGAGIKHAQLVNAEAWRDAGAAVAFLWHYNAEVRIFTPAMVRAALTDRKSLRWIDVHKIPQGEGFIVFDYLRSLYALTKRATGGTLAHAKAEKSLCEVPSLGEPMRPEDGSKAALGGNDNAIPTEARHAADGRALVAPRRDKTP